MKGKFHCIARKASRGKNMPTVAPALAAGLFYALLMAPRVLKLSTKKPKIKQLVINYKKTCQDELLAHSFRSSTSYTECKVVLQSTNTILYYLIIKFTAYKQRICQILLYIYKSQKHVTLYILKLLFSSMCITFSRAHYFLIYLG